MMKKGLVMEGGFLLSTGRLLLFAASRAKSGIATRYRFILPITIRNAFLTLQRIPQHSCRRNSYS